MALPGMLPLFGRPWNFPVIEGSTKQGSASATNHSLNLPTGIVAGELLIMTLGAFNISQVPVLSFPGGWTRQYTKSVNGQNAHEVWIKTATGSEGSTISVTADVAASIAQKVARVSNWRSVSVSTGATGQSTTPNPDSLDPGLGLDKFLWLALSGGFVTPSGPPSNYENFDTISQGVSDIGIATRFLAASSEDPGAFGGGTSNFWDACTVAIAPR